MTEGPSGVPHGGGTLPQRGTIPLRVASFNIRFGHADDGDDSWPLRRAALRDQLLAVDWQFLGLQEVVSEQLAYLRDQLPHTEYASAGRDDGLLAGEHCSVFVNSPDWTLDSADVRWLSEEPETPGSIGWDATLPRIVTITRATHRPTGTRLGFASTHFCYQGDTARLESARLIDRWLTAEADGRAWILVGDFNLEPGSPPLAFMRDQGWVSALPDDAGGTNHSFAGGTTGGQIDHILVSPDIEVAGWAVERDQVDGRWPSDHYLVWADLEIPVSS
jgi:endonuclease/exonuclease/phosphatase family metal-dependent hydrolase